MIPLILIRPGANFPGGAEVFNRVTDDPTHGNRMNMISGQQSVVAGDEFWIDVIQDSGSNITLNAANGWIRVIR